MYGDAPGERLSEAERAGMHTWLRRRGRITVELEAMTPLVEARYFARYRAHRVLRVASYVTVIMVSAWALGEPVIGVEVWGTVSGFSLLIAVLGVMYAVFLAVLWYQGRADRRIGAALRHRAARSSAVDLRAVLGGRFVEATIAIYCVGLLIGGAAGTFASDAHDRLVSLVFVIGLLLCVSVSGAVLADVARRPVIAEDDQSLAADDTMRRDDAYQAVLPPVPGLGVMAAIAGPSGWWAAVFGGYGGAVAWLAVAWWRASVRARRADAEARLGRQA